ncbi:MAG: phosphotransferase family protein [Parvularcula sp.]
METSGNQAHALRAEDKFDVAAVDRVLKEHVTGLAGTPSVGQFVGGASNLTYALDYPERRLVLRRPPVGPKPKSGHSMIREYRVMKALKPHFSAVPDVVYYASDEQSVLGAEFYVMDRVDGVILGKDIPPEWDWSPAQGRRFCETVWSLFADLHAVDFVAAGLGDFGKAVGYVERQVLGWNKRFEAALTPDAHPFEDVRDWIVAHRPADTPRASLLHGDYRIDNLILNETDPMKIEAVLDWELAALGDPLMDLGAALAYWIEPGDPAGLKPLEKQPSGAPGMMTRQEIVAFYSEKSGIKIDDFTFYYVFGLFRLAAIAQQIYRRYYEGATTNPAFKNLGHGAMGLCAYCQLLIREGMK